jgi:hypothetical protein
LPAFAHVLGKAISWFWIKSAFEKHCISGIDFRLTNRLIPRAWGVALCLMHNDELLQTPQLLGAGAEPWPALVD